MKDIVNSCKLFKKNYRKENINQKVITKNEQYSKSKYENVKSFSYKM